MQQTPEGVLGQTEFADVDGVLGHVVEDAWMTGEGVRQDVGLPDRAGDGGRGVRANRRLRS
jgi:hypothetical protein